jgi:large subunit ribosomal protein L4
MNRKERRLALRTAISSRGEDLIVVENFAEQLPQPKTKELVSALGRWGAETGKKTLLIMEEIPENVALSARNICYLKVIKADSLNIYDLLVANKIVATANALTKIQEAYSD